MTTEEKVQKHLELAKGSLQWLCKIPKLDNYLVHNYLINYISKEFIEHELPLYHFEIDQPDENTYNVTVNKSAFFTIKMGKEVDNG
jgi:hypothetical protein